MCLLCKSAFQHVTQKSFMFEFEFSMLPSIPTHQGIFYLEESLGTVTDQYLYSYTRYGQRTINHGRYAQNRGYARYITVSHKQSGC